MNGNHFVEAVEKSGTYKRLVEEQRIIEERALAAGGGNE